MDQRRAMIDDYLSKLYSKKELAERYDVSRVTIDHWIKRFDEEGPAGLADRSHAVQQCPHRTDADIEQLILTTRREHPGWGPMMLRDRLSARHTELTLPAVSTIALMLKRNGLITPQPRRRAMPLVHRGAIPPVDGPNQVWNIDFKGEFLLGNARYCYPLTLSDTYSRYVLCCSALPSTAALPVRAQLQRLFQEYGLPDRIRSDNGTPFSSAAVGGLSRLSLWWIKLGIEPVLTRPGRPQDNGQHERMHRTLKADTTRPPQQTMPQQQRCFDDWRRDFNDDRPHQGINRVAPGQLYQPSPRAMPRRLPAPEYPGHYRQRVIAANGQLKLHSRCYFLSEVLGGERVGVEQIDEAIYSIYFFDRLLARLDTSTGTLR